MRFLIRGLVATAVISSLIGCGGLNSRIDEKIEQVGSELTDVAVDVERVKIRIGGGSGQITGLTVANPEGYVSVHAFDMDLLRLNIGLIATIGGPPVVLDELLIDSPVITLEFNEQGTSNLNELAENVKRNLEAGTQQSSIQEANVNAPPKEPVRIAVRRLMIRGVTFNLRRADGTLRSGILPTIELTDVGGEEGETAAGLGAVVITAITSEILRRAVAHKLTDGVKFDQKKVLAFLQQRFDLSTEQMAGMRTAAEKISDGLNVTVDTWVAQGFIDIDALSRKLEPYAEEARESLLNVLDEEQLREFQTFLENLDEEAVEALRTALVDRLTKILGVTRGQMQQLRPILRRHFQQLGVLVTRLSNSADRSVEEFAAGYESLQAETRRQLREVLDADQLARLTRHQDELRAQIRQTLFPDG